MLRQIKTGRGSRIAVPFSCLGYQLGFTYLGVLAAIALLSAVLGTSAEVWHTMHAREQERQLLFAGYEFRRAIERYYRNSPGAAKHFPPSLEALLEDERYPGTQRYLRRIYRDPVTGQAEWGLVKGVDGGIAGLHSLSTARPFKRAGFGPHDSGFEEAEHYADWVFAYRPQDTSARNMAGPIAEQ